MSGHEHRDAIAKRAGELMREHPSMTRASASARAAYELETVEKSAPELTLAAVIDAVLATATEARVAKGADSWIAAQAAVMADNKALLNLRCCSSLADVEYGAAVAALRKSAADERDFGDRKILESWVAAIDAVVAPLRRAAPRPRQQHVEKRRSGPPPAAPVIPRPQMDRLYFK